MKTLEEHIAEIEAFYNPKIAQRQKAVDDYNNLVAARDAKINKVVAWYAKRAEVDRLLTELGEGPGD